MAKRVRTEEAQRQKERKKKGNYANKNNTEQIGCMVNQCIYGI
ncbi:hypothetical protein [Ileibacterium valens]|nr:hypothetical protein [Ileibacterium valens]